VILMAVGKMKSWLNGSPSTIIIEHTPHWRAKHLWNTQAEDDCL